jgi:uncharacterized protein YoxC
MTENDAVTIDAPDDEFDAIPSITPEREDIDSRRGRRSFASGSANKVVSRKTDPDNAPRFFLQGTAVVSMLIVSIVGTLIAVVYLFLQLQQANKNLATATLRVEQLETRLVTTDTTLTKSEVLLAAKLKSMDALIDGNKTEVRKLWAAAEKNSKALQAQNAEIQQQKPALQKVINQAQQTADQLASDGVLLKTVDSTVKEAAQRMEIVQESLADLNADTKSLKDKQSSLEGDMGKRVTSLEDTAKSTDVFRRNTLDELRRLREEISRSQAVTATKVAP